MYRMMNASAVQFFQFVINTTAYPLGQYSLHLFLLKSSMVKEVTYPCLALTLLYLIIVSGEPVANLVGTGRVRR